MKEQKLLHIKSERNTIRFFWYNYYTFVVIIAIKINVIIHKLRCICVRTKK